MDIQARRLNRISEQLTACNEEGIKLNHRYDQAPDGSREKQTVVLLMDRLSKRRRALEDEAQEVMDEMGI